MNGWQLRRLFLGVGVATAFVVVVPGVPARAAGAAGTFVPLPPARILDTRSNIGLSGAFAPNQTRNLTVTGVGGVPGSGVDAVLVNVTATDPSAAGWLTLFPAGAVFPTASHVNFTPGQTVANLAVIAVGHGGVSEGKVSIANTAVPTGTPPSGKVDVIADVVGYYVDASAVAAARFTGLTPARVLDTRSGMGLSGPFAANQTRNVLVADVGAPADAVAVVLNVTATSPSAAGWLTVFAAGAALPLASNLNFVAGQTVPNLVVVKLGPNGEVAIANTAVPSGPPPSAGTVHIVADVVGFYQIGSGADLTAITPARVLDTRNAPGIPMGANATISVDPRAGSPLPPVGSYSSVVANVTVTGPTQGGWLTAFPSDASLPLGSSLNFVAGQTVPNLVKVRVGADGTFKIANTALPSGPQPSAGTVHVVVDVVGYFVGDAGSAPAPPAPLALAPSAVPVPLPSPNPTESTLVSGLNRPWDIAFLPGATGPDGAMLYTENDAKTVSAYISSAEKRRVLLTSADVDTNGEGGTMGIAVHPNYPTTPWVYVCLTSLAGNDNRVVRYTLNLDGFGQPSSLAAPVNVVTGMLKNGFHNGCRVRFQPGSSPAALFVTMGDAGVGPSPQDPNGINGKVLRVDENGAAYPGNPFGKRWYTRGHRNPQGIAFRPTDNAPWNAEHGPGINDEVNSLTLGGNSGWDPNTGGNYDQSRPMTDLGKFPNAIRPKWRSGDIATIAPSGLAFLQNLGGEDWKSWNGNAIVAVLKNHELRMLIVDGSGDVTGQVQIYNSPVRLRVPVLGPDGKLYVTSDENPGDIRVFDPS